MCEWMGITGLKTTKSDSHEDPLFAELFKHTARSDGFTEGHRESVKVTETSDDPCVAKLIQRTRSLVFCFVECGLCQAMKNHPCSFRAFPARETEHLIPSSTDTAAS